MVAARVALFQAVSAHVSGGRNAVDWQHKSCGDDCVDEAVIDPNEVLLMRADEVARTLGLSRSKIYQMMSDGALPVVRVGRAVRVPKAALRDWVAHHTTEAA